MVAPHIYGEVKKRIRTAAEARKKVLNDCVKDEEHSGIDII